MQNKYEYIISYSFDGGVGAFTPTIGKPINSLSQLKKIKEFIEYTYNIQNVTINSHQLVSKRFNKRKFVK